MNAKHLNYKISISTIVGCKAKCRAKILRDRETKFAYIISNGESPQAAYPL